MSDLTVKHCVACEGAIPALDKNAVNNFLKKVPHWETNDAHTEIRREFKFKNFYHTMGFVNALAWIANQEIHHPDLEVGYNYCRVRYSTHAVNGLTENDFICAAKINELPYSK